ncbi:MAG: hypothetical protein ACRECX_13480 [Methyloceanibacter sp.]
MRNCLLVTAFLLAFGDPAFGSKIVGNGIWIAAKDPNTDKCYVAHLDANRKIVGATVMEETTDGGLIIAEGYDTKAAAEADLAKLQECIF